MGLNESDTRAKLIDPALHARGWTENLIRREETAGAIEIVDGKPRKRAKGRVDYLLRVAVNAESQPVAVALIEAKAEDLPPNSGMEQAKLYASCKRLNVPFVFSTNGHLFVEFDRQTGQTSSTRPLTNFPTPAELRARYEQAQGFKLDAATAKPLLARYPGGEATRRYYQDAAIRAALEKLARGEKRALLSLATGSGKTFIAVQLLKKIADAGLLKRALFVCDRDELRSQGLGAFQNVFGADAAEVYEEADGKNHARNARIHIATYQTLDVDKEDGTANFLAKHYPPDYFSHIIIDECHRSAWGKWSQVLTRNPNAVQIGLTATPRTLEITEQSKEAEADLQITADNLGHFGEPVYEYDMAQGIEDGYLAACEIHRVGLFLDDKPETEGIGRDDLKRKRLTNADTGKPLSVAEARERYDAPDLEDKLLLPERVAAMCRELFRRLCETGGPEQKTIIFCARDRHADAVAAEMNNLYAALCAGVGAGGSRSPMTQKTDDGDVVPPKSTGGARSSVPQNTDGEDAVPPRPRLDPYAFKCTASVGGAQYLADLRGATRSHFVATTVDLLTTGVDVPIVQNIVFFKYVRSPIAFYQMVGRGTRLHPPSGKLMFRVYDFTNATRLFGQEFKSQWQPRERRESPPEPPQPPEPTIQVEGFEVRITDAGRYVVTEVDGKAMPVTVEEYKERLAARLVAEAPTLEAFRSRWIEPPSRRELLGHLPDAGRSALLVQKLEAMDDYDLYDVLAELGYGLAPRTRAGRAEAFAYKHQDWLQGLPPAAAATLQAMAAQFALAGTDGLENPHIFDLPEVRRAGGLAALRVLGEPAALLHETKARMFAA